MQTLWRRRQKGLLAPPHLIPDTHTHTHTHTHTKKKTLPLLTPCPLAAGAVIQRRVAASLVRAALRRLASEARFSSSRAHFASSEAPSEARFSSSRAPDPAFSESQPQPADITSPSSDISGPRPGIGAITSTDLRGEPRTSSAASTPQLAEPPSVNLLTELSVHPGQSPPTLCAADLSRTGGWSSEMQTAGPAGAARAGPPRTQKAPHT